MFGENLGNKDVVWKDKKKNQIFREGLGDMYRSQGNRRNEGFEWNENRGKEGLKNTRGGVEGL